MKTIVVAGEGRHILRPRRKDQQRTMGASFEATALGFPVLANGVSLYMNHSQLLFHGHFLDSLLTFRDSWGDQHVPAIGISNQSLLFSYPVIGILCGYAIRSAVEEYLMLLGLTKEEHVAEGTITRIANGDTQCALEQVRKLPSHHVAERIVAEVSFPIVQLPVAHKDVVVVVGFKKRGARF